MPAPDTVLVIRPDGTASSIAWPGADDDRRAVIAAQVGERTKMRRCGKGIVGFSVDAGAGADDGPAVGGLPNPFASAAYLEQGVVLDGALVGPVLFARNPSKGSVVQPLTAAQSANLLVVTGARLS